MEISKVFSWRLFAVVMAAATLAASGIVFVELRLFDDWPTRGQFGDSFGIVTSLFSVFSFAGVICTILIQQSQIITQRADAADTARHAEAVLKNQFRSTQLSMLTYMLDYYRLELDRLGDKVASGVAGANIERDRVKLRESRATLEVILSNLHEEVVSGLRNSDVR